MPVKESESCSSSAQASSSKKSPKPSKQATIGSLFQKSAKRKSSANCKDNDKKKLKLEDDRPIAEEIAASSSSEKDGIKLDEKPAKKTIERCNQCRQDTNNDEIQIFDGDDDSAVEEFVMLCDPRLSLLSGDEENYENIEERPQHKLTEFTVYDKHGHLCAFDTGLIDKNIELFFSGHVKPIYEESPDTEGGIATKRMGPINEWFIAGFDGGESALIGFGTAFAEYILMRPSDAYAPIMSAVFEKICMSKIVIEFALNNPDASYEELLNKIETTVPPENCSKLSEDSLLRHAQFLVEQVESYDSAAADDEDNAPIIASTCMRDLIKLAGVTLGKRRQLRGVKVKAEKKSLGPTLATTTPLVQNVFDTFFKDQLDLTTAVNAKRKKRCGVCDVCQQADCGSCRACKDMVKFGGSGRAKQCCINRRCPNMVVQEAEDDAGSQDEEEPILLSPSKSPKLSRKSSEQQARLTTVKWACEPHKEKKNRKLYKSVYINNEQIDVGDYVKVSPVKPTDPLYICRIAYMWEEFNGKKFFHAQWLYRSSETILGETSDPSEVFFSDDCDSNPIGSIVAKCKLSVRLPSNDWFNEGGREEAHAADEDKDELFVQKWYDTEEALYADPPKEFLQTKNLDDRYCPSCDREKKRNKMNTPQAVEVIEDSEDEIYNKILWNNEEFAIGDCVYILPNTYKFKLKKKSESAKSRNYDKKYDDEQMYPEVYRRGNDYVKGSNVDIAEPFKIGCILRIEQTKGSYGDNKDLKLTVRKFYRPENTHKGILATYSSDLNMIYWCDEETTISFDDVERKCYVQYIDDNDTNINDYTEGGPDRFYFKECYNADTQEFDIPPNKARNELTGNKAGKKRGKGKAKKGSVFQENQIITDHPIFQKVDKLKTLDIFAGCGGLSEGLHEVGIADSRWAVEFEPAAAQAYRLNNPGTTVFNADCNGILKMIMEGRDTDDSGQKLPKRGEVDLLCGGPPCQGFSGMNRFNHREYSMFKNSLVATYLSYCDYFRPKFFILENVRNFVSFKKNMVLKLAMRCLLKMGYQCEFGILQAGCYGVAQTRRRAIIIAAAPGEILPKYPEPLHVFAPKALSLSVMIDEKRYQSVKCLQSAPYRTITVRDTMGDLPPIKNGANKLESSYENEASSHFQKKMRGKQLTPLLRDHVCKDMSPLVEARMTYIPCKPGSDWRYLPNDIVKLRDGNTTKKLNYLHNDAKQGTNSLGDMRGVCSCATGGKCDPSDRQFNTLIPWCLPHTGNRHNHWAGLYGRLEWDGFFSTTVTNPEPMGKQGRVLHPEQNRVVSVRECARSQGFPDNYRFYGSILDKHRQIGNAVAPPMAAAIGQEIRKVLIAKNKLSNEEVITTDQQSSAGSMEKMKTEESLEARSTNIDTAEVESNKHSEGGSSNTEPAKVDSNKHTVGQGCETAESSSALS